MKESITTVYLVRHGETVSNVEGRFRGRVEIPLNSDGIHQAHELADSLCNIPFSAIYSSPLPRAMQTAEPIALSRCTDIIPHPKFNNIDLGDWTNRLKSDIMAEYSELWETWITTPEHMQIPNAETIEQVRMRSFDAIKRLVDTHSGERFAVVTHRAVLKPLIAALLNIPEPYFWKLHLDTASYSIFRYSRIRGWTLINFNLTHHLSNCSEEVF
ncbi:histidine phosphatase family protein [bacterium]|nr:histidine phosphatase family protein [bacterium]